MDGGAEVFPGRETKGDTLAHTSARVAMTLDAATEEAYSRGHGGV